MIQILGVMQSGAEWFLGSQTERKPCLVLLDSLSRCLHMPRHVRGQDKSSVEGQDEVRIISVSSVVGRLSILC